jgi:hypothetical protein
MRRYVVASSSVIWSRVRIRHPSIDPADLSREFKIEPEHSFRAGDARRAAVLRPRPIQRGSDQPDRRAVQLQTMLKEAGLGSDFVVGDRFRFGRRQFFGQEICLRIEGAAAISATVPNLKRPASPAERAICNCEDPPERHCSALAIRAIALAARNNQRLRTTAARGSRR